MSGSRKRPFQCYSIFGQEDMVIAEAMIKEGKIVKIPQNEIPSTVLFNEAGVKAVFAIMIANTYIKEFEERVAMLRL